MQLSYAPLILETAGPFRISREKKRLCRNALVRLEWERLIGLGEAASSRFYGEDADTVSKALERVRPLIEGASPLEGERLGLELAKRLPGDRSARAAVDIAIWDLLGKQLGAPLYRLLGLAGIPPPPTSFTLGISPPEEMRARAEAVRGQFRVLKVKVGVSREEDALSAVREVWGGPLRIDANGAWGPEEAIVRIRALERFGLEFVEQPVPPGDPDVLARVREAVGVPVFADESALSPEDIYALAGKVDGVVVKLAKSGGVRTALRAIATAKACGLKVMLGCMVESSLGIAAAVHLSPLADYTDLDGHLLLAQDPFEGVVLRDGRMLPPEGPGLGVRRRGSSGRSSA